MEVLSCTVLYCALLLSMRYYGTSLVCVDVWQMSALISLRFICQYRTVWTLPKSWPDPILSNLTPSTHSVYNPSLTLTQPSLAPPLTHPHPTLNLASSYPTLPISSPYPFLTALLPYPCTKGWEDFNDRHLHSIGTDRWVNHTLRSLHDEMTSSARTWEPFYHYQLSLNVPSSSLSSPFSSYSSYFILSYLLPD